MAQGGSIEVMKEDFSGNAIAYRQKDLQPQIKALLDIIAERIAVVIIREGQTQLLMDIDRCEKVENLTKK